MKVVGNIETLQCDQFFSRLFKALERFSVDRFEESPEFADDFVGRCLVLDFAKPFEQASQFAPMSFGELGSDVSKRPPKLFITHKY